MDKQRDIYIYIYRERGTRRHRSKGTKADKFARKIKGGKEQREAENFKKIE